MASPENGGASGSADGGSSTSGGASGSGTNGSSGSAGDAGSGQVGSGGQSGSAGQAGSAGKGGKGGAGGNAGSTGSGGASGTTGTGGAAGGVGTGGGAGSGSREGFGTQTPGGAGGKIIHITQPTDQAVRAAFQEARAGNAIVVFDVPGPIEITSPLPLLDGAFVTIEGNCATLVGTGISATAAMVDVRGHDVIVQNLRLRNAGDNLRAQAAGAYNIVFDHISSTGAMDDGISIGYGAHDITVQYSFLAGNTRSMFIKYQGATNISVHHTWIMKQWIRGPLINGALVDLRNLVVEDWTEWGTRFEEGATGNAVNNLWVLTPYAASVGGKPHATLYGYTPAPGPVWVEGNEYRGNAQDVWAGTAPQAYATPAVTTQSVAAMEPIVRGQAGCVPRDAVEQAYIDTTTGWDVADGRPFRP